MKKYKDWLNTERTFLGSMVGTGKINEDYVIHRLERIEGALKLIKEFENEGIK